MAKRTPKFVQVNKDTYNSMKWVDIDGAVELYRIKDSKTGLYSAGGMTPKFTRYGKTWKRRSDLVSHLRSFAAENGTVPASWEVEITYATVTERASFNARDVKANGLALVSTNSSPTLLG